MRPIGVSRPTRVSRSFSSAVIIRFLRRMACVNFCCGKSALCAVPGQTQQLCIFLLTMGASRRFGARVNPRDTIYALSSGRLPAAIAVVRISGPRAGDALKALAGRLPQPRQAMLARVRDPQSGELIDEALALWFPGPKSETGEDTAELQLHG